MASSPAPPTASSPFDHRGRVVPEPVAVFEAISPSPVRMVWVSRAVAHSDRKAIRFLRNRIAHREPTFSRSIADKSRGMRETIAWPSPVAAAWMDRTQGVTAPIPLKPSYSSSASHPWRPPPQSPIPKHEQQEPPHG